MNTTVVVLLSATLCTFVLLALLVRKTLAVKEPLVGGDLFWLATLAYITVLGMSETAALMEQYIAVPAALYPSKTLWICTALPVIICAVIARPAGRRSPSAGVNEARGKT